MSFAFLSLLACCSLFQDVPSPSSSSAPSSPSVNDLRGIWAAEPRFGPEISGALVVRKVADRWWAEVQGHSAPVEVQGGVFAFTLPGGRGSFRGQVDGDVLRGFWRQPLGRVEGRCYATPTVLRTSATDTWLGEIRPMDDRLSLYIELFESDDGGTNARMRNPERNIGIFFDFGKVELVGRELLFYNRQGKEVLLRGRVSESLDRWNLDSVARGAVFEFRRRQRDQASGYFAGDANRSPYSYRAPLAMRDGWPVATPEEVGMQCKPLAALVQSVLDTRYELRNTPYIQSIQVARRGRLVLDEYFHGFHRDQPRDTRSSTKTLTAMLVGLAIDRGAALTTETRVLDVFAGEANIQHVDDRKRALEIGHLLTMQSGFHCDDDDDATPGNEDRMQSQQDQLDWTRYTLDLPMARMPGERAVYCTAGINLLGAVVERSMGVELSAFFAEAYAEPLAIHHYHLILDPTHRAYMGGGMRLRPRDHLKMGQLLVDGGRWRGQQVLSSNWVERMSAVHASIHEPDDYGFGVWRATLEHDERSYSAIYASGNGGQMVIAIPQLDLVVLFSGGNYMDFRTWIAFLRDLVPRYVIAAVQDGK